MQHVNCFQESVSRDINERDNEFDLLSYYILHGSFHDIKDIINKYEQEISECSLGNEKKIIDLKRELIESLTLNLATAFKRGSIEIIKLLLEHGAIMNYITPSGATLISTLIYEREKLSESALIKRIQLAIDLGLDKSLILNTFHNNESILLIANGSLVSLNQYLISQGANPNMVDFNNNTLAMIFRTKEYLPLCDLTQRNIYGNTALTLAVRLRASYNYEENFRDYIRLCCQYPVDQNFEQAILLCSLNINNNIIENSIGYKTYKAQLIINTLWSENCFGSSMPKDLQSLILPYLIK